MPDGRFIGACYKCKSEMWLPTALYDAAKHSHKIGFFCPYGHEQVFREGESEEDKLRRERDRLKQDVAYYEDSLREARAAEKEAQKLAATRKGQVTKLRKRTGAGVCPCCNRTISQLARHMQSKHPTFRAEMVQ